MNRAQGRKPLGTFLLRTAAGLPWDPSPRGCFPERPPFLLSRSPPPRHKSRDAQGALLPAVVLIRLATFPRVPPAPTSAPPATVLPNSSLPH